MLLDVKRTRKGMGLRGRIPAVVSLLFLLFCNLVSAGTWTGQDIGSVGVAGSDSYNGTTGVYTIAGSGADINGTADACHFVYQTLTADGELVARVASVQNTNASAKAGVMVRQSTAAGSINAFIAVTPTSGILSQQRTALNGSTTSTQTTTSTAPYWLKIVKDGTLISVYQSPDNVAWTYEGATRLSSLTSPVDIGFAVTSHSNTVLCTATFDNITLTSQTTFAPTLPWHDQDIGSPAQAGQVHVEQYLWSLYGGGSGLTGASDSFHYAYQALSGNGVAIAQVNGLGTSTASAGVVMRQDLTAGSAEAAVLLNSTNGISFATRGSAGATVASTAGAHVAAPYWVKLVRLGSLFSGYQSTDGKTWTLVGSQTITMTGTIYVGVGATCGNNGALAFNVLDRVWVIPTGNYLGTGGMASGANHNLYLQSNGNVWAWGLNANGQIGDGTTTTRTSPVQITTLSGIETASGGASHSLALKNDGTVWVWGLNTNGQLGDGTTTQRASPFQLTTLSGMMAVSAGASHSIALKNDGTVWVWGLNTNGQLGDGTTTQHTSPEQLTTLSGIVAISAGGSHSLALRDDGAVFAWGYNSTGQLGIGSTKQQTSPVQITTLSNVAWVSAGTSHSLIAGDDGSVWAWGDNSSGEVGDGTTTVRKSPVQVTALSGMTAVQASNLFSLALKNDGTVWTWGKNSSGQLGNNTTTQQNSPVQASGLTGAVAISAGTSHSAAVTSDGAIWTWGSNSNGQLGNGTTTASLVPRSLKPVITSAATATGTVGVAFSYTITASCVPTSFNATGLPAGLSVSTSTGAITGTPTTAGTFPVTLSATNVSGTGSATLTLTINPPAPVITSATTATGTKGVPFNYQITATNSPTSFSATGLPAGLSVNTSTGLISGTPTATGASTVTLGVTNVTGTGNATLTLTVNPPAPVITSATTATGTNGVAFNYQITATNSPTSFSATGLPAGLSVNAGTGVISGTPTATGTSFVTIGATNAGGTGTATLTLTVNPPAPVITSATTATGTTGVAFSYTITASNTPTSYSATGLPSGLSVNTSTGVISGIPTATGTSSVTIGATNTGGTGTATLTLTVNPPAPVIGSATTATGTIGVVFSYTITASNTPTSYGATGLPSGLSVNSATGVISGTPTAAGIFTVALSATNGGGTGTATLTLPVSAGSPVASGLALWLKADAGVTQSSGNVSAWADQSGIGNNASQSSGSSQPTLVTGGLAGKSSIRFNGSNYMAFANTANLRPTNHTILAVAKTNNTGVSQFFLSWPYYASHWDPPFVSYSVSLQTTPSVALRSIVTTTTSGGYVDNVANNSYDMGRPHQFSWRYDGSNQQAYADGVLATSHATTGAIAYSGENSNLVLGTRDGASVTESFNGDVYEVLLYNRALTDSELHQAQVYLADKYGLYDPNATWPSAYSSAVQAEITRNQWNKTQADNYVALQTNNPTMLTNGLALWLKADAGVTTDGSSNVNSWVDQTGNYTVGQGGSAEPTYVAGDVNGQPALRFNGNQSLFNPANMRLNADLTLIVVGSSTVPGSVEIAFCLGSSPTHNVNRSMGYAGSEQLFSGFSNDVVSGIVPNANVFATQIVTLDSTRTGVDFYLNGVSNGSRGISGLQDLIAGISVGSTPGWNVNWNGDIAEVLVYDHKLTSTELSQVGVYLADKYGLYHPNATWPSAYSSDVQAQITANHWNKSQADAYLAFIAANPSIPASGLNLWLRADAGVMQAGGNVSAWTDQSINGHVLGQGNATYQPQLQTDATTGKPALRFNGNQLLASGDLMPCNGDITVVMAASTDNPPTEGYWLGMGGASGGAMRGIGHAVSDLFFANWGGGSTVGNCPGTGQTGLMTFTFTRSSSMAAGYLGGVAQWSNAVGVNDLTGGVSVGALSNFYGPLQGGLSEVLVYNRVLTSTERQQAEVYLADKYGLYHPNATWPSAYSSAVQAEITLHQWNKSQADNYVALQSNTSGVVTTGLTLWLKADAGVTTDGSGNVNSWADQAGNYTVTQAGSARPTYVASDVNGKPGVRFNGSQWLYSPSSLGPGVNQDMTIITVGMTTNPTASTWALYLGQNTSPGANRAYLYSSGNEFFDGQYAGCAGGPAPGANTVTAEIASINSTLNQVTFYQNGTQTAVTTVGGGTMVNVSLGITVGAVLVGSGTGYGEWQGDIVEQLVYDHKLTSAEVQQVSIYLANKYGLYSNVAPVITPAAGSYTSSQTVSISSVLTSGTIHYTLDGTEPTADSPTYTGPITLTGSALVQAAVFFNGQIATPISSAQFYINDAGNTGLPTVPTSLSATVASGSEIDLSWSLSGQVNYYGVYVYRSSDGGATYQLVAALDPSTTSYADTNVQSGMSYQYFVGTLNTSGESDTSVSSSVTPTAPTTLNITVTTPSNATPLP